ncbi:CIS tube protein [Streptomyces sp. NPDC005141]
MTTPLAKATLQEVGAPPGGPQPETITVQFNPASLRLQMANNADMKKAFGKRPVVQYDGTSSSTVSFDLIFDTSDEGTTEQPIDVRARAKKLERFLLPAKGVKSVPPRVRFSYGTFELVGLMTTLNQEYDLFSSSGVPLRAKLAVTINEQLPEYEAGIVGPASNTAAAAKDDQGLLPSGAPRAGADRTGTSLAGESAPAFASRMGLDPMSWAKLDLGGQDPLSLTAGASIDFSASVTAGLGLSAGVTIGASAGASVLDGSSPDPRTVTAAGGVQKAIESEASRRCEAAANAQRAGFAAPSTPEGAGAYGQRSLPGTPYPGPDHLATPLSPSTGPQLPDWRGLTYGTGVPLRRLVRRPAHGKGDPPVTDDPTVPRWLALPASPPRPPHTAAKKESHDTANR